MKEQTMESSRVVASKVVPKEEFLTIHELMALLKIKHRQTIYDLIDRGMPAIRVGRNYRFIKHEVIHFLKERSRLRTSNKN